jgi:hypothetical protein
VINIIATRSTAGRNVATTAGSACGIGGNPS